MATLKTMDCIKLRQLFVLKYYNNSKLLSPDQKKTEPQNEVLYDPVAFSGRGGRRSKNLEVARGK